LFPHVRSLDLHVSAWHECPFLTLFVRLQSQDKRREESFGRDSTEAEYLNTVDHKKQ